jgi:threonine dehydrogenase-like Zn-dependent dehydrogenase
MGLLIAQVLAAHGAVPVVLELSEARLALARALGLNRSINPAREDVPAAVAGMTDGVGLDGAILTVVTEAILSQTQRLLRPGGRINIFAAPSGGPRLTVDLGDLYHRELSIFSTYSSTPGALTEAFSLLTANRVRVQPLISHRLPLTAFDEGVELQRTGKATKVIFHP